MRLLVTGGAGYIGSHVSIALLQAGHEVVIVDSFSNSTPGNIDEIMEAAGRELVCIKADIRDRERMREVLGRSRYEGVLHLAALKSVPESMQYPERYDDVNVRGTAILLEETLRVGICNFVFCSSAAVYGRQTGVRLSETDPPNPLTPYAQSKWTAEQLLRETALTQRGFRACSLRCFNPIGSNPSAKFGNRSGSSVDLLSKVLMARENHSVVDVYGMDYPTPDRSAIRDFIHVMDVADGCVAATTFLAATTADAPEGAWTFNLGTGQSCSVLRLVETMEKVGAKPIRWRERAPRNGDIPISVADPTFSAAILSWQASRSLEQGCVDALRFFESTLRR